MAMLPEKFKSLERWSAWCLATETERNARRVASEFDEISAFANAVLPQVDAICSWIDAHRSEHGYDAKTQNLFYMLLSLAEVGPAIESYDPEVEVVDGYETKRFAADEKHCLRPAI